MLTRDEAQTIIDYVQNISLKLIGKRPAEECVNAAQEFCDYIVSLVKEPCKTCNGTGTTFNTYDKGLSPCKDCAK